MILQPIKFEKTNFKLILLIYTLKLIVQLSNFQLSNNYTNKNDIETLFILNGV